MFRFTLSNRLRISNKAYYKNIYLKYGKIPKSFSDVANKCKYGEINQICSVCWNKISEKDFILKNNQCTDTWFVAR